MFITECTGSVYYISMEYRYRYLIYNNRVTDKNIANLLNISIEEYAIILRKYNARKNQFNFYFLSREDCEACCQYLEEIYGILIVLSNNEIK